MIEAWFSKIESWLFTTIKKRMRQNVEFRDVYFTTANEKVEKAKFPVLYFHELEQLEQGRDLDNTTVNAVLSTIEIQVFSKTAAENKSIMTDAVLQMKRLRYNVTAMPIYTSAEDKTIFLSVARFQRVIGGGDADIVPQD